MYLLGKWILHGYTQTLVETFFVEQAIIKKVVKSILIFWEKIINVDY